MSFFEDTTPASLSPELTGHEEVAAVEAENEQVEELETEADVQTEEVADPDAGHSDELLAGKYKSVDELVKGYKNLETQFHKNRQQPTTQTPQQQQPQESVDEYNERVYNAFNRDPAGTINYLVQQQLQQALAPITQERQLNSLGKNIEPIANEYAQLHTDEGSEQFFAKVREIAEDLGNPELMKNPSQRVLRMAATELWGTESKAQIYDKALAKGREDAENARRAKLGVAVSVTKKPNEAPKTEADIIREGILGAGQRSGLFG